MYMTDRIIAKIIHQCWVSHQIAVGQPYNDRLTDAQRESLLSGYRKFINNPTMTCQQNHEEWMEHRLANGWTLGPVKDEALKQHPDLIPYDQLPAVEKTKNEVFLSACRLIQAISDL